MSSQSKKAGPSLVFLGRRRRRGRRAAASPASCFADEKTPPETVTGCQPAAAILVPSRDWIGAPRLLVMQENPLVAAGGLSMRSQMQFHAIKWAPILILVCLLVSACSSSDRFQSSSTAPSWVQNLNEPPPNRVAATDEAAELRADLNRSVR